MRRFPGYFRQILRPIVYASFAKFRPQFSEACGVTYTQICEMFNALQSISGPLTNTEKSFQIDA